MRDPGCLVIRARAIPHGCGRKLGTKPFRSHEGMEMPMYVRNAFVRSVGMVIILTVRARIVHVAMREMRPLLDDVRAFENFGDGIGAAFSKGADTVGRLDCRVIH